MSTRFDDVNRRVFLSASGTAAGLSFAEAYPSRVFAQNLDEKAPAIMPPTVDAALRGIATIQTWSSLKKTLARQSDWLDAFTESAVNQAIRKIKTLAYYEPLLLEALLKDASQALDRCLAFRKEAYDLEIAAVKAAADYDLFLLMVELDAALEANALGIGRLAKEETGYRQAASLYHTPYEGFAKHDETLSESAMTDLQAAQVRQRLLSQRTEVRKAYEAAYHLRHTAPGNAHNFKERQGQIISLLADDLREAYEKLFAVQIGLRAVFDKEIPLPNLNGEGVVDDLVIWTRDAMRFLDLEAQQEVDYEIVIPLTQPWRSSKKPIIDKNKFAEIFKAETPSVTIGFTLDDIFFNQDRVRLRSVGLAFGAPTLEVKDQTYVYDPKAYWRLRATIHTPKQRNVREPGRYYVRPPVVLGSVPVFGHAVPVAISSGPECHNIDPRGEWKIVLNQHTVWSDNTDVETSPKNLLDLKLHLRVVAKPDPYADSVFVSNSSTTLGGQLTPSERTDDGK